MYFFPLLPLKSKESNIHYLEEFYSFIKDYTQLSNNILYDLLIILIMYKNIDILLDLNSLTLFKIFI